MWLCVEKLSQCRRNHRIKHVVVRKIMSPRNRSRCHKFVNWFSNLNFFDPEHGDLRFGCTHTNFSSEVDFPALKFHRVTKFCQMQFPNRKSRVINHTTVRISSTSMIQHTTSTFEVTWSRQRIQPFSFRSTLSPCCIGSISSQFLRGRCRILWIVEDCGR